MSNNKDVVKQNNAILGYGEKLKVLVGRNEDGTDETVEYHFTPVSLKDIPKLIELLDKFMGSAEKQDWNSKAIGDAAKLILMSIKKMHPDVSEETVKAHFGIAAIAKAATIIMGVNDFLSEMESLKKQGLIVSPQDSKKMMN